MTIARSPDYRRIATEEGWMTPELMRMYLKILETRSLNDPGFYSLWGFFGTSQSERARRHLRIVVLLDERPAAVFVLRHHRGERHAGGDARRSD